VRHTKPAEDTLVAEEGRISRQEHFAQTNYDLLRKCSSLAMRALVCFCASLTSITGRDCQETNLLLVFA
jgi:hypothetical protein